MSNKVKLFRCSDGGAPTLTGQAGSLIALLDACLVNGYNVKSPASITRSGTTATFTYATAHGYVDKQTILASGADQGEYNGEFQIRNVSTLTFDVTVTGTPATSATGTLSTKTAPLGFTKPLSGTNKAAYRSGEPSATGHYLRIDDTGTVWATPGARVAAASMFEAMTDIDTGTRRVPTAAASVWPNNVPWHKSWTTDATQRPWYLVGDGEFFYIGCNMDPANRMAAPVSCFGNVITDKPADSGHAFLGFGRNEVGGSSAAYDYAGFTRWDNSLASNSGGFFALSYDQINIGPSGGPLNDQTFSTRMGGGGLAFPSPVNNGLYWTAIRAIQSPSILRGMFPGLYCPLHAIPIPCAYSTASIGAVVEGVGPNDGDFFAHYIPVETGASSANGQLFFDITGPWR